MASLFDRLRSVRHGLWFGVSGRVRWSRGTLRETPALALTGLDPEVAQRIAALRSRYQIPFEARLNAATSRRNYEYLDILERAWSLAGCTPPDGGELYDVGCASFWYAPALQAFFRPASMTGVEVDGYRLYRNGYSRRDSAAGYLEALPNARFLVADYTHLTAPADLVTAWFPFVTPTALLAWRLPLRLLQPQALFARIAANLRRGGRFVMVNHGPHEAGVAARYCTAAGLVREFGAEGPVPAGVLSAYRAQAPLLSCWRPDIS